MCDLDKFKLFIKIDVNDGDMETSTYTVTMSELNKIIPLFKLLTPDGFGSYIWDGQDFDTTSMEKEYEGILTPEQIETISDMVGFSEHGYCRCIDSIYYVPCSEIFTIL